MGALHYRPELDGLRAVSVLSVLVYHLNSRWLPGGFVGVDVFFAISGFLITSIIVKQADEGQFSIWRFYQRRIARILPAFLWMALLTFVTATLIYSPQDLALAAAYMAASVASLTNVKLMFQGSYFDLSPDAHPFMHCWSLSVEEQFYLVFPLLVLALLRRSKRVLLWGLIVLAALSLAACILLTSIRPTWAFYLLPTRAWEMLAGALLAVGNATWQERRQTFLGARALGWALLAASILFVNETGFPGYSALLPVTGALCLISSTQPEGTGPKRLLANRPLVFIGKISYSLYLWHWPVFSLTDYHLIEMSEIGRVLTKLAVTGTLATASYWLIESPARSWLGRTRSLRAAYALLALSAAVLVPLGLSVQKHNYINAKNAAAGKIVFNHSGKSGTIVLMGDSHASMYGKIVKEFAEEENFRLVVISVAGADALPPLSPNTDEGSLWHESLAVIQKEKPDAVVLASAWAAYLDGEGHRIRKTVEALSPSTPCLILITQPPILPESATRSNIRKGVRPPFSEEPKERDLRLSRNDQVKRMAGSHVKVIDLESFLSDENGEVAFYDSDGHRLYHDLSHLSYRGTRPVRELLHGLLSNQ